MPGIVQQNMARPKGRELNLKMVQKQVQDNLPPELRDAYKRVIVAGMKVMFDPKTHQLMLKQLQEPGPIGQKLGQGIAGLMLLLFQQSNKTMPPQILIPAGLELLMQAVYFLRKSKLAMPNNADIGEATQVMVDTIMQKFGVDPQKFSGALDAHLQQQGAMQ